MVPASQAAVAASISATPIRSVARVQFEPVEFFRRSIKAVSPRAATSSTMARAARVDVHRHLALHAQKGLEALVEIGAAAVEADRHSLVFGGFKSSAIARTGASLRQYQAPVSAEISPASRPDVPELSSARSVSSHSMHSTSSRSMRPSANIRTTLPPGFFPGMEFQPPEFELRVGFIERKIEHFAGQNAVKPQCRNQTAITGHAHNHLIAIRPPHADDETLFTRTPDDVGCMHLCILNMRRNHREIVFVESNQFTQCRHELLESRKLSADALNGGAAGRQFFLKPLEAAVEMIDTVDRGLALGGQAAITSETEARRSVAITGAPRRVGMPSIVAVSPSSAMRAPNRASSCTCRSGSRKSSR